MVSQIHVFGIRHHGPGCARSLVAALDDLQPEAIVIEGPADAADALTLAANPEMQPPVSLLLYPSDEPRRSVSFPFANFSPEWQAIRWGFQHQIRLELMDLPMAHRLAIDLQRDSVTAEQEEAVDSDSDNPIRTDPIAILAESAGYADHELWWEEQIERRENASGLFEAILEAMQTIRAEFPESREDDLLRESFMRKTIRKVCKETIGPVAVICGAWHSPVLTEESIKGKVNGCRIKDDQQRLKGIPKIKTTATWIPWTHSRLSYKSGYGAGIHSPGWYAQIWASPEDAPIRWLTVAARLLRDKDLSASSANVIDALRLAESTASLRNLRSPGLQELNEAIVTVFCQGDPGPLQIVRKRLEIGDELGSVPVETPSVPLAKDLATLQKSLRMKPSAQEKLLDLDMRKEMHRERSFLLHRLNILEIPWGEWKSSGGGDSTFHEIWKLEWSPEFAVSIIEANIWGNTVELAATNRLVHQGRSTKELQQLTDLLSSALYADLNQAVPELLELIRSQAAIATDVQHLLAALLPLAQIVRYSDVRRLQADMVFPIVKSLFDRAIPSLVGACTALDDSAAAEMLECMRSAQQAILLIADDSMQTIWFQQLQKLADSGAHGLLRGWACRSLFECEVIDADELARFTRLQLSPVSPIATSAAWATGLLKGSGLLLIHQASLWKILDQWISGLQGDQFQEMLPVLRRAFSDFSSAERRQMGTRIQSLNAPSDRSKGASNLVIEREINRERAEKVLPVLKQILGGGSST